MKAAVNIYTRFLTVNPARLPRNQFISKVPNQSFRENLFPSGFYTVSNCSNLALIRSVSFGEFNSQNNKGSSRVASNLSSTPFILVLYSINLFSFAKYRMIAAINTKTLPNSFSVVLIRLCCTYPMPKMKGKYLQNYSFNSTFQKDYCLNKRNRFQRSVEGSI